ncbi:hypothetical protein F53441_1128 [Fusarium austroafricanum]|uniref:Uncharacterized protein n=1 Tax=Fusarium austroafricanum TaxID=2364996 RepID=A0A8H4KU82_9HYPO|nr:hypothetical protein F53441_1128 [Fusarium austroafricanum]
MVEHSVQFLPLKNPCFWARLIPPEIFSFPKRPGSSASILDCRRSNRYRECRAQVISHTWQKAREDLNSAIQVIGVAPSIHWLVDLKGKEIPSIGNPRTGDAHRQRQQETCRPLYVFRENGIMSDYRIAGVWQNPTQLVDQASEQDIQRTLPVFFGGLMMCQWTAVSPILPWRLKWETINQAWLDQGNDRKCSNVACVTEITENADIYGFAAEMRCNRCHDYCRENKVERNEEPGESQIETSQNTLTGDKKGITINACANTGCKFSGTFLRNLHVFGQYSY